MYCTIEQIKSQIPEEKLVQLTDDKNLAEIDINTVNQIILSAEDTINGYLRGIYNLPLNPVPGFVSELALNLAIYKLYFRRIGTVIPEDIVQKYKDAIETLEKIRKREIVLDVEDSKSGVVLINSREKIFNDVL